MLILVIFAVLLVACGGGADSDESDETNDNATENDTGEESEEDGEANGGDITKLVVGTDATYAPMEYIDDNGEIVGIDIDIINAIAEEMGL